MQDFQNNDEFDFYRSIYSLWYEYLVFNQLNQEDDKSTVEFKHKLMFDSIMQIKDATFQQEIVESYLEYKKEGHTSSDILSQITFDFMHCI